jgi:hypothetical protein
LALKGNIQVEPQAEDLCGFLSILLRSLLWQIPALPHTNVLNIKRFFYETSISISFFPRVLSKSLLEPDAHADVIPDFLQ